MAERGEAGEWDRLAPVVAHGLLGPIAGIRGYAQILVAKGDRLDPTERAVLLERMVEIADLAAGMLADMVRGLPPDLTRVLDQLDAETQRRHGIGSGSGGPPGQERD